MADLLRLRCVTDHDSWLGDYFEIAWFWVGSYEFDDTLLARFKLGGFLTYCFFPWQTALNIAAGQSA